MRSAPRHRRRRQLGSIKMVRMSHELEHLELLAEIDALVAALRQWCEPAVELPARSWPACGKAAVL
ncbi:MAG: hypothetical protein QM775_30615 [Pirellulales bacterium]